jgi:hypothetical protein
MLNGYTHHLYLLSTLIYYYCLNYYLSWVSLLSLVSLVMIILVVAKLTFWNDDYNDISFANNNLDNDYYLD